MALGTFALIALLIATDVAVGWIVYRGLRSEFATDAASSTPDAHAPRQAA